MSLTDSIDLLYSENVAPYPPHFGNQTLSYFPSHQGRNKRVRPNLWCVIISTGLLVPALMHAPLATASPTAAASGPAADIIAPADFIGPSADAKTQAAKAKKTTAFVTGYSYYDNTPVGTAAISHPVIHKKAGGRGTYKNPITVAVGHRYVRGRDVLDFPRGTRMYMYYLDRYFIVEDTCGNGKRPDLGPCHVHPGGTSAWLDIWVNGEGTGSAMSTRCAEKITGKRAVLINPPRGLKVSAGSVLSKRGCRT